MSNILDYQTCLDRARRAAETRMAFEAFMAAGGAHRIHFQVDGDDRAAQAINQVWNSKQGFDYILRHTLDALIRSEKRLITDFQAQVTADSLIPETPVPDEANLQEAAE